MLEPFQRTTKELSRANASLSEVIPFIDILKQELDDHTCDQGVQVAKAVMLTDLTRRFTGIYSNKHYYVSTLLDPRFKTAFLDEVAATLAKDELLTAMATVRQEPEDTDVPAAIALGDGDELANDDEGEAGQIKKPKFDMWGSVRKVVANKQGGQQQNVQSKSECELTMYLQDGVSVETGSDYSPLDYWEANESKFPLLSKVAYKYLPCPPTSVASESLFSTTGNIDDDKRRSLLVEHIEMLTVIKKNVDLL
jgi:hypothetical protein